jgi:hypothetical protein
MRYILAIIVVCIMTMYSPHAALGQESSIRQSVDQILSMQPSEARLEAARRLFDLTREKKAAQSVSDADIKALISLLDDPDMSVQYWTAGALGNIGPRAKAAIPKLTGMLVKTDCLYLDKSPADAARYALKRMKAKLPPPCPTSR